MRTVRGITALFILSLLVNYTLYGTKILISKGNWGDVREDEIHTVLQSATEVFKPYSPILKNNKIRVYKTESYPKIHYDKDEDGFHRIKISAKGRFWCQYVFQFSHELGHLICKTKRGNSANDWFEETLCETASLFALNQLSKTWSNNPPFPNWKSYAKEFRNYRIKRVKESAYPDNFVISSWWKNNRNILSKNANLRKQNLWMAIQILDIIEKQPRAAWSACEWLNHSKNYVPQNLEQYLQNWKSACPQSEQKRFVEEIINLFGVV